MNDGDLGILATKKLLSYNLKCEIVDVIFNIGQADFVDRVHQNIVRFSCNYMNHPLTPFLYQINISQGGVPKHPVKKAWVSFDGVEGDRQRNQAVHGGRDRALCLFSWDLIEALRKEGHNIGAGSTGENLTLAGLTWAHLQPGDRLRIGRDVHIKIISYAEPCRLNAQWFVNADYKRISQKIHPGWSRLYASVISEGLIRRGDLIYLDGETTARAS